MLLMQRKEYKKVRLCCKALEYDQKLCKSYETQRQQGEKQRK
jgi:hypothetical protein